MPAICFYFQAHQPFRTRDVSFFDLGKEPAIFDKKLNKKYLRQALYNSYYPSFQLFRKLLRYFPGKFRFSFSLTGTLIDQIEEYYPGSFRKFARFIKNEDVELISETYSHSLAFFYSKNEFIKQITLHNNRIRELFEKDAKVFRNAELAYRSDLAILLSGLNYHGTIIEGTERILKNLSPNHLYADARNSRFKLLVRNRHFSELFSEFKSPRTQSCKNMAKSVIREIEAINEDIIVIGFDIENLGEHHHRLSGIFNFLYHFIRYAVLSQDICFVHPSEAIRQFEPAGTLEIYSPVTWHGYNKDLSAWNGNVLQEEAIKYLYSIEQIINETENNELQSIWRKLQSTDHFLYMTASENINGKTSRYFSPYRDVHRSYQTFIDAVACLDIYARKIIGKPVDINPPASE